MLLVRHASREVKWGEKEKQHHIQGWTKADFPDASDFSKSGWCLSIAMAGRLCDQLELEAANGPAGIQVDKIWTSSHEAADQTGEIFEKVLKKRKLLKSARVQLTELDPGQPAKKAVEKIVGASSALAVVAVGHQPQLTEIAKALAGESLPGGTLPVAGSEVAALRKEGAGYRLRWLLTEKPASLLKDLRAKIQSKFDVAKFFLGALVVGTGLSLNDKAWTSSHPIDMSLAGLGVLAALTSLGFTAATLFSYDRLLMPRDFWLGSEESLEPPEWSVLRPPSQIHVVLYYEMVHIWTHLFIPAITTAFLSLGLQATMLARAAVSKAAVGTPLEALGSCGQLIVLLVLVGLAFLVPVWLFNRWKPRLGFSD